jgi:hypothetical protein
MIAMITTTNRVREQNMACPEHFDGNPRLAHVHLHRTNCAVGAIASSARQLQSGPTSIPANTVGDLNHVKIYASEDTAEKWFRQDTLEGVAFEYEILD